jgi:hypothetical protein
LNKRFESGERCCLIVGYSRNAPVSTPSGAFRRGNRMDFGCGNAFIEASLALLDTSVLIKAIHAS